jgi:hypothetical protein
MKAILIDAVAREVREIELPDDEVSRLAELNRLVGGYLEVAFAWRGGDVLFVDEDGLRHNPPYGFSFGFLAGALVGSGIVVGREVEGDQYPDGWSNGDPVITADEVRKLVRFFRREG